MQINKCQSVGWITLLLAGASWRGTADAAGTILVCSTCSHTTIQSAVNDAVDNDIIRILPGRYVENVTAGGKSLTFLGQDLGEPRGAIMVMAAGRGPVFTLGSGVAGEPAKQMTLVGLTISGGNHNGGTGVGGGVQVRAGAWLRLVSCTVRGNYATSGGGVGINSPGAPASSISYSLIIGNDANGAPLGSPSHGGGVYVAQGSAVEIGHSTISNNGAAGGGGGIFGEPGSNVTVSFTTVTQNISARFNTSQGQLDGDGGGMETRGDFTIADSDFIGNTSDGTSGGGGLTMAITDTGPHTITRSTFSHNTLQAEDSPLSGAAILAFATNPSSYTLDHSYVEQNSSGGAIWNDSTVTALITNSVIADNVGGNVCSPTVICH
jgi:hypothetical protein